VTIELLAVAGARPNFIKIAPLLRAIDNVPEFRVHLVHTGQHYDPNLSDVFFRELGISMPNAHLNVGSGSHATQTAQVMLAIEEVMLNEKPDVVVVVGDVNSTLAATLVAVKLGIPVAHIEAGLRSFDRAMPEEINRILTDAVADFLFTPSPEANENLLKEGIPDERIFLVGNIMIDSLLYHVEQARQLDVMNKWNLAKQNYVLVTLHRPSNVDDRHSLKDILAALDDVQQHIPVLFPMHPRTRRRLREFELEGLAQVAKHLHIIEPVGYLEFVALMMNSAAILTDSGGVQEETTVLGVPCLTLRDNTERPITVEQGTNKLIGAKPANIFPEIMATLQNDNTTPQKPPLWDGRTAERIVKILRQELSPRL